MLYKVDYESHRLRNPARAPGTCEWVFRHPKYQQWREARGPSLLWISADPGCGKSVLASFLVDEFRSTSSQATIPTTVCFFFFKDDSDEQNKATLALDSLAHQIFRQNSCVINYALQELQAKGVGFTQEFHTMWNVVRAAVTDSRCSNVLCVLDALDECEESSRRLLMKVLVDFFKIQGAGRDSRLKVIVTGRPYASLERGFMSLPSIRLRAEDDDTRPVEDVRLYVSHRAQRIVESLHIHDAGRVDALVKTLASKADQSFIWVSLILDQLELSVEGTEGEFVEIMNNLPNSLNDTYEKMLRHSPNTEKAKKILRVVVAASRPLTLEEMNIALALRPDSDTLAALDLLPNPESSLKQLCGLLVRVFKSRLYLVHQTAREFLCTGGEIESSDCWKHSIGKVASQAELCKICVDYLMLKNFQIYPIEMDEEIEQSETIAFNQRPIRRFLKTCYDKHPFFQYATCNWVHHFHAARMKDNHYVGRAASLCRAPLTYSTVWVLELLLRNPSGRWNLDISLDYFSPLGIAIQWDLVPIAQNLLAGKSKNRSLGGLSTTARDGSAAMAELLIRHGAQVQGRELATLHQAALYGRVETLRVFLRHGADVRVLDNVKQVPPDWDNCEQYSDSDSMIWEERQMTAEEAQGPLITLGDTVLHRAIDKWKEVAGHREKALLLLSAGVDVRQMMAEPWGANALDFAASRDAIEVLDLLLHLTPPSFDLGDINKAFVYAARFSAKRAVRLLADNGADINATDTEGRSHLSLVVAQCRSYMPIKLQTWDTLAVLSELGAEIDESLLLLAISQGTIEVFQYLLHHFLAQQDRKVDLSADAERHSQIGQRMLRFALEYRFTPGSRRCWPFAGFLIAEGAKPDDGQATEVTRNTDAPFGNNIRHNVPDFRSQRVTWLLETLEHRLRKGTEERYIRPLLQELGDTSEFVYKRDP